MFIIWLFSVIIPMGYIYFDEKYQEAYFFYTTKLIIKEWLIFKNYFSNPIFAVIIQERSLFKSDCYLSGYGSHLFIVDMLTP